MKGKYITYQILLACLSKPSVQVKKEDPAETEGKLSNNIKSAEEGKEINSIDGRKAA
jgi:hypothetical protein